MSWARASRALRSASSRRRRLSPRSATRTSTDPPRRTDRASASSGASVAERRAHDHQARHRRDGGVVLGDELLGHLRLAALALVGEIEAVTLGKDPVAHLEDLRVCAAALHGDRDQVGARRAPRRRRCWRCISEPDGLEAVAVDRRPLELLGGGRLGHLAIQVALDVAVAAREEVDDRLDVSPVLLAVDVADAGRLASLDVVVEARDPERRPGSGPSQVRYWNSLPSRSSVSRTRRALEKGPK